MSEAIVAQAVFVSLILTIFTGLFIWGLKTKQFYKAKNPKSREE